MSENNKGSISYDIDEDLREITFKVRDMNGSLAEYKMDDNETDRLLDKIVSGLDEWNLRGLAGKKHDEADARARRKLKDDQYRLEREVADLRRKLDEMHSKHEGLKLVDSSGEVVARYVVPEEVKK